MKSAYSTKSSMESALRKALVMCEVLLRQLHRSESGFTADTMPDIRDTLAVLNQRVYEYNAYRNVLETE